jgi:BirA family biotin operon repressor/biotin-[acetyl-CoA-carboxylase] ligase
MMFTERELRKGLKTKTFGKKIYTFQTIDSTNNCAKAVANIGGPEGIVVIAEEQTAGKGRLGRRWLANPNENLTFSLLLRPSVHAEAIHQLPLYVGIALAEAIEKTTGIRAECKWPNDILLNRKKVAGILVEGSLKERLVEYVVVGIGINVNQTVFPADLAGKATSLRLECKREIDRAALFRDILTALEAMYQQGIKNGFGFVVSRWMERSTMINKPIAVSLHGTVMTGIVKGLSREGGLILQANGADHTLFAGDVTILGEGNDHRFPSETAERPSVGLPHS